ncbi:MAG TPA: hypothetical protein VIG94_04540 [Faecalibacter sp.]
MDCSLVELENSIVKYTNCRNDVILNETKVKNLNKAKSSHPEFISGSNYIL